MDEKEAKYKMELLKTLITVSGIMFSIIVIILNLELPRLASISTQIPEIIICNIGTLFMIFLVSSIIYYSLLTNGFFLKVNRITIIFSLILSVFVASTFSTVVSFLVAYFMGENLTIYWAYVIVLDFFLFFSLNEKGTNVKIFNIFLLLSKLRRNKTLGEVMKER
jgi:hypothetical protein